MGVSYYLVKYAFNFVYLNYEYKKTVAPNEESSNFTAIGKDLNKIIILTFLGGIVAGMLGIGGGMITTPLLLSYGVDPKSATSTSNLLIIFTAFSATVMFVFSVIFFNLGPIKFYLCPISSSSVRSSIIVW